MESPTIQVSQISVSSAARLVTPVRLNRLARLVPGPSNLRSALVIVVEVSTTRPGRRSSLPGENVPGNGGTLLWGRPGQLRAAEPGLEQAPRSAGEVDSQVDEPPLAFGAGDVAAGGRQYLHRDGMFPVRPAGVDGGIGGRHGGRHGGGRGDRQAGPAVISERRISLRCMVLPITGLGIRKWCIHQPSCACSAPEASWDARSTVSLFVHAGEADEDEHLRGRALLVGGEVHQGGAGSLPACVQRVASRGFQPAS